MNSQSLATDNPSSGRRRRRSSRRPSVAVRLLAHLWPEQVGLGKKLGIWVAVLVLAYLGTHAGAMALANLEVIRVENQLGTWYRQGRVTSPVAMDSALAAIHRANRLHPDNPYVLTLHARLLDWRAYNGGNVIPQHYREALALHKHAAALRPLWPDTWADMAQLKVRMNEYDRELDSFLVRADELGPYTPAVHVAVAQANLLRVPSLSGEQLALLETHVVRGMLDPRSKGQVMEFIQRYGQQSLACQWLQGESGMQKLCP